MTVNFNLADLSLTRYPTKHSKDLRAWDAADEYLLSQPLSVLSGQAIVLINDAFGALHCALEQQHEFELYHINDSWCSQTAINNNRKRLTYADFTDQEVGTALVKLPKSLSLLNAQLRYLASNIASPIMVYFSGMQKHVSQGHLDTIKQCGIDLTYLPTQRKARMYQGVLSPAPYTPEITDVFVPELNIHLQNHAGVFAEQKIDIGSRFFIEHFNLLPKAALVADVGCGNGYLSLAYQQRHPQSELHLFDESSSAVASATSGFALNFPNANVHIKHHDGLCGINTQFDLILINPPFHQQNTVTTDIALSMFAQAQKCMHASSELWIVANSHLNYHKELKRWFKKVTIKQTNQKFVIICAQLT